ncbi:hypothetical protein HNV11_21180 [Spirosoma taeanense]|uniref:Glycosyltransferase RgtA/B/C/D-like domain-containing protein n=1 Tax=Spirosoma taeanense TaxID=2735870 RepID=A0A6M5YDN0_9BACT|nr:hypothetical protein [Spirosoma taeanense]QJW91714.1 hypothetical protein HNV11_21180 [Spirosoma taeanense]
MWNQIVPDGSDPKRGLVAGRAKAIRVDEYGVLTPYMLSQAQNDFALQNEALGGGSVPLVLGVPAKHFITFFRPHFWGFFVLDTERGFAWWWNFKVFGILLSAFFLCLLLTKNNFWLSLFGGFWILLSSGTLWWFSTGLTEMIIGACLLPVAVIYLLYGETTRQVIIGAILAAWGSLYFASHLYPPYQVPLAYLMAFLLVGYVLNRKRTDLFANLPVKGAGVLVTLGLIGIVGFLYYRDAKPTLDLMLNTAYPGKRVEYGGTGFVGNWFSEYFNSFFISDQHFPATWLNICELSHYLTFAPIILIWLAYQWGTTRQVDYTLAGVALFVLFGWLWIEVGFPEWLSKLTLMSTSPTRRAQIPFGLGNVLLTILFLGDTRRTAVNVSSAVRGLVVAAAVATVVIAAYQNYTDAPGFFRTDQLVMGAVYFGVLNALLIPVWSFSYRQILFCVGIVIALLPNLSVNPLAKGLSPVTENVLYRAVESIRQQDPEARWVVFGNNYLTYLVGATGVKQVSGVKYTPNFATMRVIDPTAKRDTVYNRYAHSVYRSYPNPTDTTIIDNGGSYDAYGVYIDPCSPKLKKLNVKYIVFEEVKQPVETRCMTLLNELGSLKIYRINN